MSRGNLSPVQKLLFAGVAAGLTALTFVLWNREKDCDIDFITHRLTEKTLLAFFDGQALVNPNGAQIGHQTSVMAENIRDKKMMAFQLKIAAEKWAIVMYEFTDATKLKVRREVFIKDMTKPVDDASRFSRDDRLAAVAAQRIEECYTDAEALSKRVQRNNNNGLRFLPAPRSSVNNEKTTFSTGTENKV